MSDHPKNFVEHLAELRKRVMWCLLGLVIGAGIAFPFQNTWLKLIIYPARESVSKLSYLSPQEPFFVKIKLSVAVGLLIALPVIVRQLWLFIAPGLYEKEKKWITRLVGISLAMFWAGVMFAYWVIIPLAMNFFTKFGGDLLEANITISNYIGFASMVLIAAGTAFQIPLVLIFLMRTGIVKRHVFTNNRGAVFVIILILSAFFTPPDIVTMLLMAGPLYFLFEASLWVDLLMQKRNEN